MALKPFLDYLEKEKPSIRPMMDKTFRAYRSQLRSTWLIRHWLIVY